MKSIINNPWITVIILLLLTANIATLGYLWTHKPNNGHSDLPGAPPPNGQVFEFVTNELLLDSAQQQAYKILREEHQKGQRSLQDSIRKAKDNFFTLLQQPSSSDSLIQLFSSKIAVKEQELEIFNFKHFKKLRAICTAGQQQKFDTIIKEVLRRLAPGRRPQGPPPVMADSVSIPSKAGKAMQERRPPPPMQGDRMMPPPPGNGPPDGRRPPPLRDKDGNILPPPPHRNGEDRRPPPPPDGRE